LERDKLTLANLLQQIGMGSSSGITARHRSAARAIQKHIDGGVITDKELADGISVLNEILPALVALGERYHLVTADLNNRKLQFETYQAARKAPHRAYQAVRKRHGL